MMLFGCKGVIFDFNGTLFMDSDKHVLAWGKLSRQLRGMDVSLEELQSHFYGVPNNRIIGYLLGRDCPEEELSFYSEKKEAYYRDYCAADTASFHLVDGANAFFTQLQKNAVPFTIASASIKSNIDFFVESFGLSRWFDPQKIVYDDGRFQNKTEMFRHAAHVIGVPAEECMIFEDSETGIRDALTAGCRNVVVIDSMGVGGQYADRPGIVKIIRTFEEMM